jgi:hypothetical protein
MMIMVTEMENIRKVGEKTLMGAEDIIMMTEKDRI